MYQGHQVQRRQLCIDPHARVDPQQSGASSSLQVGERSYKRSAAEIRCAEDVANGAIRAFPHFLKLEFGDTRFIGSDGCTLDSYVVLSNGVRRIECYLVTCGIGVPYRDRSILDRLLDEAE